MNIDKSIYKKDPKIKKMEWGTQGYDNSYVIDPNKSDVDNQAAKRSFELTNKNQDNTTNVKTGVGAVGTGVGAAVPWLGAVIHGANAMDSVGRKIPGSVDERGYANRKSFSGKVGSAFSPIEHIKNLSSGNANDTFTGAVGLVGGGGVSMGYQLLGGDKLTQKMFGKSSADKAKDEYDQQVKTQGQLQNFMYQKIDDNYAMAKKNREEKQVATWGRQNTSSGPVIAKTGMKGYKCKNGSSSIKPKSFGVIEIEGKNGIGEIHTDETMRQVKAIGVAPHYAGGTKSIAKEGDVVFNTQGKPQKYKKIITAIAEGDQETLERERKKIPGDSGQTAKYGIKKYGNGDAEIVSDSLNFERQNQALMEFKKPYSIGPGGKPATHPNYGQNSAKKKYNDYEEAAAGSLKDYPSDSRFTGKARAMIDDYKFNTGRSPEELLLYSAGLLDEHDIQSKHPVADAKKLWAQHGNRLINEANSGKLNITKARKEVQSGQGKYANEGKPGFKVDNNYKHPNTAMYNSRIDEIAGIDYSKMNKTKNNSVKQSTTNNISFTGKFTPKDKKGWTSYVENDRAIAYNSDKGLTRVKTNGEYKTITDKNSLDAIHALHPELRGKQPIEKSKFNVSANEDIIYDNSQGKTKDEIDDMRTNDERASAKMDFDADKVSEWSDEKRGKAVYHGAQKGGKSNKPGYKFDNQKIKDLVGAGAEVVPILHNLTQKPVMPNERGKLYSRMNQFISTKPSEDAVTADAYAANKHNAVEMSGGNASNARANAIAANETSRMQRAGTIANDNQRYSEVQNANNALRSQDAAFNYEQDFLNQREKYQVRSQKQEQITNAMSQIGEYGARSRERVVQQNFNKEYLDAVKEGYDVKGLNQSLAPKEKGGNKSVRFGYKKK